VVRGDPAGKSVDFLLNPRMIRLEFLAQFNDDQVRMIFLDQVGERVGRQALLRIDGRRPFVVTLASAARNRRAGEPVLSRRPTHQIGMDGCSVVFQLIVQAIDQPFHLTVADDQDN